MGIAETFQLIIVSCIIFSATAYVTFDFYYVGCFRDAYSRDLGGSNTALHVNSPRACFEWCYDRGYEVAGVQYGYQCFCGHSYGKYGEIAEGFCDSACRNNENFKCGGAWANSIFQKDAYYTHTDRGELMGHLGCYKDAADRDLDGYYMSNTYLHLQMCFDACKSRGYRYAGVQYGTQCYCGNSYGKHGSKEISDCRMECGGSGIYEDCGGIYANNVYDLEYEHPDFQICHEGGVSTRTCAGSMGTDTTPCPSGDSCLHRIGWFDIVLHYTGFCCPSTY